METHLTFGTSSVCWKTTLRRMCRIRVKSFHSFFSTALEPLETLLRAAFPWILHLDTKLQELCWSIVLGGIHIRFSSTAHLNQVTRGPPLKAYDQRGLQSFADQLRDCQNAKESIGYLDEMNSANNLRSVDNRLSFHLKMKWLEVADKIQESGQRPRIHHVSQFACAKARAANNPVFWRWFQ